MSGRQVAIVGGGPAGLIAALKLAKAGHGVTVYERMPSPARKLLMAGRGGLNLTHGEAANHFLTRYGQDSAQLTQIIAAFPADAVRAFVHELGQETFIGSSGRVFPVAMKASPLLRVWLARLEGLGVSLRTRCDWQGWEDDGALRFAGPDGLFTVKADACLLALGGASWPRLGATGDWVELLAARGVAVTPLIASNCGARIGWSGFFARRFAGQPLKTIALACGEEAVRGEAIVTAQGLEGGAVYALGRAIRSQLALAGRAELRLDLKPDRTVETLAGRLSATRRGESSANRLRKATGLSPVAIALLRESGSIAGDPPSLAASIKAVRLTVTGMSGLERAISTAGGIAWSSVTDDLMLRALPGIFAAGEMLDWDAPTGGYLLTGCLATGVAAAAGIERWLRPPVAPRA